MSEKVTGISFDFVAVKRMDTQRASEEPPLLHATILGQHSAASLPGIFLA